MSERFWFIFSFYLLDHDDEIFLSAVLVKIGLKVAVLSV